MDRTGKVGAGGEFAKMAQNWPTPDANAGTGYNQTDSPGAVKRPLLGAAAQNWPTPRAEDSECCGNHPGAIDSLTGVAGLWNTPMAQDSEAAGSVAKGDFLTQQAVSFWMSPQTSDHKGSTQPGQRRRQLSEQAECLFSLPDPETAPPGAHSCATTPALPPPSPATKKRLNPAFVEILLGLPPGWTALEPVETASWWCRLRWHFCCLQRAYGLDDDLPR